MSAEPRVIKGSVLEVKVLNVKKSPLNEERDKQKQKKHQVGCCEWCVLEPNCSGLIELKLEKPGLVLYNLCAKDCEGGLLHYLKEDNCIVVENLLDCKREIKVNYIVHY